MPLLVFAVAVAFVVVVAVAFVVVVAFVVAVAVVLVVALAFLVVIPQRSGGICCCRCRCLFSPLLLLVFALAFALAFPSVIPSAARNPPPARPASATHPKIISSKTPQNSHVNPPSALKSYKTRIPTADFSPANLA